MPRNIDMTALRAFVTVAECGSVTKAAGMLHLTQSAVSMQIKRLEQFLDAPLFTRAARGLSPTGHGDQLLSYGRRILSLNDEVIGQMTEQQFEGDLKFGVPSDIVYPHIPVVLQKLALDYPQVRVQLISSLTGALVPRFEAGDMDVILTTETDLREGGETLARLPLKWYGAPGGKAGRARPVRLAFVNGCMFLHAAKHQLDGAGIPWQLAVESDFLRSVDATVSADLAIHAALEGTTATHFEEIRDAGLPELPSYRINLYINRQSDMTPLSETVGAILRGCYAET